MYYGGNCRAVFRVCWALIGDVIDLFGKDVAFSDETEESVTVLVYANEISAAHFTQSFAPDVTVLEPKKLRENVKPPAATSTGKISIMGGNVKNE